jgi:hypothetical protein
MKMGKSKTKRLAALGIKVMTDRPLTKRNERRLQRKANAKPSRPK